VVVRTSEVIGSAFLRPRSWHKGVTRTVRALGRLSSGDHARSNAHLAAVALAQRRREREEAEHLLTAHAAVGREESATAV
jgi:hypothetical protein